MNEFKSQEKIVLDEEIKKLYKQKNKQTHKEEKKMEELASAIAKEQVKEFDCMTKEEQSKLYQRHINYQQNEGSAIKTAGGLIDATSTLYQNLIQYLWVAKN